jgi:aldehyde dehydrogenase (NAD+)
VGPVLTAEARGRVAAAVEQARAASERVIAPHAESGRAAGLPGAYLPPTIVVVPPPGHEIVREETFGPVLVVQRAGTFEEALAMANGVPQGLVAALFSGPGPWRAEFLAAVRAGIVKWNRSTADADAFAPFGGWKASGVGPPEHGPGREEFYTRLQAVYG